MSKLATISKTRCLANRGFTLKELLISLLALTFVASIVWLVWRGQRSAARDLASLVYELVERKDTSDIAIYDGSTPLTEAQRNAVLSVAQSFFVGGEVGRLDVSREPGAKMAVASSMISAPGRKPTPFTLIGKDADKGGALQMLGLLEKSWEFGRQAGRNQKISKAERFQACAAGARKCEAELTAAGIGMPTHSFRGPATWSELADYYEALSRDN